MIKITKQEGLVIRQHMEELRNIECKANTKVGTIRPQLAKCTTKSDRYGPLKKIVKA